MTQIHKRKGAALLRGVPPPAGITGTDGDNVIEGTSGNDLILGLGGDDRIHGRAGNDQIDGGDDDDLIFGDEGDDVIHGGAGFDYLSGDIGDDLLYGDADGDTLDDRASGDDQLFGGAGFDDLLVYRLAASGPGDTILMNAGADGAAMRFLSNRYADIVTMEGGGDHEGITVFGGGTVTVDAGGGDDYIDVDNVGGALSLTLGAGTDSINLGRILNGGLVTVNDFAGGGAGDRIYVQSIVHPYQLIQRGADTILQIRNGGTGTAFVDYVLIKNILAADFVLSADHYLWTPGDLIDDPAIAVDDAISALEGALVSGGALLANDSDPDGPALAIAAVNGLAANLGQFITLASGAQLRVEADGGWSYNALGATFVPIPDLLSGASNLYYLDSFTYRLAGGGTATVTVQVQGIDSADILRGTAGGDVLAGGAFDDLYHVENAGDIVVEQVGEGSDRVVASVSYALGDTSVEALDAAPGTAAINLTGNGLANTLRGNGGVNVLIGGGGADILIGGAGNDIYRVEEAGDIVVEAIGGGADAVYAVNSYTLAAGSEVELLSAIDPGSTAAMNLTGNEFANFIYGTAGSNTLIGGGGADTLIGGAGNDFYRVEEAGDIVVEGAGGGFDSVYAVVSYTLAAGSEIELLSAIDPSSAVAINLTGNEYANRLDGTAGVNVLIGGGGADILFGGAGDDIYRVEEAGDIVVEAAGGGADSVYAVTSYTLAAGSEVELLSAIDPGATGAIDLTGNEYANRLYGNAGGNVLIGGGGDDTLTGGGGADILFGGAGDDIYLVEEAGDIVVENVGGGADSVYAVTSYALAAGSEVELLAAIDPGATGAMDLTGNEFANWLYGNAGGNVLIGGGGADTLTGGAGNDIYRVEEAGDIVVEAAGGGADSIYAVTSYTLAAGSEVELLSAIDPASTAAVNFTGNEFANRLYGNAGSSVLDGKGGNDVLNGGGGADAFAFTTALGAGNVDTVADFAAGTDKIVLDDAVFIGIGGLGALSPSALVIGTNAADSDDRIVYNSSTGQLFFDADGTGAAAAILFATLTGVPVLTANDFVII